MRPCKFDRRFAGAVAAALLLAPAVARPQQPPPAPAPDLNAPGPEHRLLDRLAGTWDVALKIPIAPGRRVDGSARLEAAWVLDGRFLRQEYSSTFMGKPLTIVRYLGFDRHRDRFVEVHFESTHTDVMHAEGRLAADGRGFTATGTHVDVALGAPVGVRTVTRLVDDATFTLELVYQDAGGRDAKSVQLTHTRR